jgi:hypothetical protein
VLDIGVRPTPQLDILARTGKTVEAETREGLAEYQRTVEDGVAQVRAELGG